MLAIKVGDSSFAINRIQACNEATLTILMLLSDGSECVFLQKSGNGIPNWRLIEKVPSNKTPINDTSCGLNDTSFGLGATHLLVVS